MVRLDKDHLPNVFKKVTPAPLKPSGPNLAIKPALKAPVSNKLSAPGPRPYELLSNPTDRGMAPRKGPPPLRPKRSDEQLTDVMISSPSSSQNFHQAHPVETVDSQTPKSFFEPISPASSKFPVRWNSMRLSSTRGLIGSAADYLASPELYGEPRPAKELAGKHITKNSIQSRPAPRLDKPLPPISFRVSLELVPEEPEHNPSVRDSLYSAKDQSMSDTELTYLRMPKRRTDKYKEILGITDELVEIPVATPPENLVEKPAAKPAAKPAEKPSERLAERLAERALERAARAVTDMSTERPAVRSTERSSKRRADSVSSVLFANIEPTWEDDIDFCYEHQAESHCNFNWTNISILNDASSDEGSNVDDQELPWERKSNRSKDRESVTTDSLSCSDVDSALRRVDDLYNVSATLPVDEVPELDRNSSHTRSTSSFSTPSSADGHDSGSDNDVQVQIKSSSPPLIVTPPMEKLLPDIDTKPLITAEKMYHDLLSGHGLGDDLDELPIPIPKKSPLRQSMNYNRLQESVVRPKLSSTPESPMTPSKRITLNSMVATLRSQLDSRIPSPPFERKSSRNSSPSHARHRSLRLSRSQTQRASALLPPSTSPMLWRASSAESVVAPRPLRPARPAAPLDLPTLPLSRYAPRARSPLARAAPPPPSPAAHRYAAFSGNPYAERSSPAATPARRSSAATADDDQGPSARFFQLCSTWVEGGAGWAGDADDRSLSEYSMAASGAGVPAAAEGARTAAAPAGMI